MKLHAYFAQKFVLTFLGVLGIFAALITMLDLVEQLRRFDAAELSMAGALELALLSMPQTLYRILPLVVILSTLTLFLGLARTSELVVTRASGRSAVLALLSPVAMALTIGGVGIAVFNPIVAATMQQYELRAADYAGAGASVLSISDEGLWLRQGGDEGQTVIRAERANLDGTILHNVTFIGFAPVGGSIAGPVRRVEAARAELQEGAWRLTQARIWPLQVPNPQAEAKDYASLLLPSTLTKDQIRDSFGAPAAIPIWDLPAFIRGLDAAGFSARLHRVWFQMELALPLFLAAMVMVGAAFTMRHTRFGRTGLMVLCALLLGFTMYFLRNFAQILGENGQIPIGLAAWAPPVAAVFFALGLLLHLEDG